MRTLHNLRISIDGLYEWGNGYTSQEAYLAWDNFWTSENSIGWEFTKSKDSFSPSTYAVCTSGGGMLHPMRFNLYIVDDNNSLMDGKPYCLYIETFKKVMEHLQEYCREGWGIHIDYTIEDKISNIEG